MTPRISIRTLLAVTAYVAVAVMGLIHPETIWSDVTFNGWLMTLLALVVLGLNAERPRSIFLLAMFATAIAYAVGSGFALGHSSPHLFRDHVDEVQSRSTVWMPHHVFLQLNAWIENAVIASEYDEYTASSDILQRSAVAHTSRIVGAVGGWLALWLYRWKNKRA